MITYVLIAASVYLTERTFEPTGHAFINYTASFPTQEACMDYARKTALTDVQYNGRQLVEASHNAFYLIDENVFESLTCHAALPA